MGLRKFMDNIKPTFSKGGKLGFLESTFDAFETFLFVPNTTTSKGAHIRDCNDMKRTMIMVVAALMPAFLFGCYNTGIQVGLEGFTAFFYGLVRVLPMVCVSYIVGLGIEFGFAQARGRHPNLHGSRGFQPLKKGAPPQRVTPVRSLSRTPRRRGACRAPS